LQSTITRAVSAPGSFWGVHFPVVFVAALFGMIHLDSGLVVAAGAVLLGLIAGELRRMSGSLAPTVHLLEARLWIASDLSTTPKLRLRVAQKECFTKPRLRGLSLCPH
jgi:CAAX prenyl protease-like protein